MESFFFFLLLRLCLAAPYASKIQHPKKQNESKRFQRNQTLKATVKKATDDATKFAKSPFFVCGVFTWVYSIKIKWPPAHCHFAHVLSARHQNTNNFNQITYASILSPIHIVSVLLPLLLLYILFFFSSCIQTETLSFCVKRRCCDAKHLYWCPHTHTHTLSQIEMLMQYMHTVDESRRTIVIVFAVIVFCFVVLVVIFVHFTGFRSVAGFITIELHVLFFVIIPTVAHLKAVRLCKKKKRKKNQQQRPATEKHTHQAFCKWNPTQQSILCSFY